MRDGREACRPLHLFFDFLALGVAGEFPASRQRLHARLLLLPPLAWAVHLGPLLAGGGIAAFARVTDFGAPEIKSMGMKMFSEARPYSQFT